jgi:hypothetical protein
MSWYTAKHNWNTVCNGGAVVLALALRDESELAAQVLEKAASAMAPYWNHIGDDGGWDEGTGYWTYGHRYALIAAEALRRAGHPEGSAVFARPACGRRAISRSSSTRAPALRQLRRLERARERPHLPPARPRVPKPRLRVVPGPRAAA